MKKLLTILLSVVMAFIVMPIVDISADTITASQLFDLIGDEKFVTSNGQYCKEDNSLLKFYDTDNLAIGVLDNDITVSGSNPYTMSYTDTYGFIEVEITTSDNNTKVTKVVVTDNSTQSKVTKGTYEIIITIADLLRTVPGGFPAYVDSIPVNAWVNGNGLKAYISSDTLIIGNTSISLNSTTSKENDQTFSFEDIKFNLNQDGKLVSIVMTISMNNDNGTYIAPVTIADVLATVDGGFPTTSSSGWVSQSGVKMYIDGNNLQSGTGNIMTLSDVLTSVGDNYSISPADFWTFTFVMESGVLSRIDLLLLGPTISYYPYAYTNQPISKPEGYTEDIEFVTNGKYVDQSTTPVSVTIDSNPITYGTQYEVTTGSTHVILKGSFVSTLTEGTHTIKIGMTGYDDISSEFTITAAPAPAPAPGYVPPVTGIE